MKQIKQIKPCPFCGGEAKIRHEKFYMPNIRFNIICVKCYSNSGWYKTEDEAIEAWNRRATDADSKE